MINKEVTLSVLLADINNFISLEHEHMGCGYSELTKGTDYEEHRDATSLFIKVTKELDCGKEHNLKLNLNQTVDGTDAEWIIHFKPKGKTQIFKFYDYLRFHEISSISSLRTKSYFEAKMIYQICMF